MGFQQGLSGLNVSAKSLDAIGNNIANASTVGYKSASAQFADVFAAALGGGGAGQIGIGASVPTISQLFTQGNITTTNNPLDLAVNGGGFFRLSDAGTPVYSRNGQFLLDKDGYIVNPSGLRLTGYGADDTGAIVPGDFVDLRLSTTNIEPSATSTSEVVVNLDSRETAPSAMTSGALTGSAAPTTLVITAANNTLDLVVDGIAASPAVDLPIATYATAGDLATALETAINSNPALAAADTLVDVSVNSSGAIVIASRSAGTQGSQGTGSSVTVTGAGDGIATLLGTPTATAGADNFSSTNTLSYTASTAQTVYDSLGNPHNLTMYFAKTSNINTWQLYTALDGTFTGTTTTTAATAGVLTGTTYTSPTAAVDAGGTLSLTVDGTTQAITIRDSVTAGAGAAYDATELATEINTAITAAFGSAVATADGSSGAIVITSASTGGSSSVTVAAGTLTVANVFGTATPTETPGAAAATTVVPDDTILSFDTTGALSTAMPLNLSFDPGSGATNPLAFTLDFTGSSQYGINFGVNQLLQDGYTSGRLTGISIASDGTVQGRYSNGKTRDQGQVVLVNFNNSNGLQSLGNNVWSETAESGQPIPGTPGQGSLGLIQSAAVEESNVDLTAELVQMITQQRVYQANAQTIKTQDQVLQTLVNLR
ncbi:MAG: flagellar hook-basal body complex protein [Pseudomonadota bacterium]